MADNKIANLYLKLCATSVFYKVIETPVIKSFFAYCKATKLDEKTQCYAKFVSTVYENGETLNDAVKKSLFEDENVYVKKLACSLLPNEKIMESAQRELDVFSEFIALSKKDFALDMNVYGDFLPDFESKEENMQAVFAERIKNIEKYGYGIFASYSMFRLSDDKVIEPIISADRANVKDFIGYEDERRKVVDNTIAFIEGRPAANTLLCGDAGTGKSSTVKAVANDFFAKGVRLIELRKDQLSLLPYVMGKISDNPLKFIIFIDDLSFNQNDDNFSMLKAALEGSASAKTDNSVIYATSNRRHIVKESFAERDCDDVHRNDTMQETLSLSDRFGLVVLFSKPNKQLYLKIVKELAVRNKISMDGKEMEIKAEEFALRKGNRSARCAEQFIRSLM